LGCCPSFLSTPGCKLNFGTEYHGVTYTIEQAMVRVAASR
jgi:hypothetical protein